MSGDISVVALWEGVLPGTCGHLDDFTVLSGHHKDCGWRQHSAGEVLNMVT